MFAYRLQTALFAVAFSLFALISLSIRDSRRDTFPFFSWELFSSAERTIHDFSIMIDEVDGQRLPVPVDHLRSTTFQSVQTYYTLQYFANRWFKNLRDKEKYRHLFEKNYLTGFTNEIHYTLVKRKWDPVAFWKRGTCEYFLGENFIAKKDGR